MPFSKELNNNEILEFLYQFGDNISRNVNAGTLEKFFVQKITGGVVAVHKKEIDTGILQGFTIQDLNY